MKTSSKLCSASKRLVRDCTLNDKYNEKLSFLIWGRVQAMRPQVFYKNLPNLLARTRTRVYSNMCIFTFTSFTNSTIANKSVL